MFVYFLADISKKNYFKAKNNFGIQFFKLIYYSL